MKKLYSLLAVLFISLTAVAVDSEYCGWTSNDLKADGAFVTLTWVTNNAGDVVITIGEGEGANSCSFRNGGFEGGIDAFVVSTDNFETTTPASTYFSAEKVYSGNTFTLVKVADVPAGAKIKHIGEGHALAWKVNGKDAYCFPDFIYTYGGVCAESVFTKIILSASSSFAKIGEGIVLNAKAVDQNGLPMEGIEIEYKVNPTDAGSVVENVFTPAKVGAITITAQSGEITSDITLYGVPSDNLALNQPCEAGYEPGNADEISSKANDGNVGTQWVTYADKPASVEWWYVDLGGKYDIAAIDVLWGDPTSTNYILQVRDEAPTDEEKADDEAWETVSEQTGITVNSEQFISLTAVSGRFVRLHSLAKSANFFRLKEVRVFGTEWVDTEDTEKPEMVKAELVSATWNKAVIAVEATDNHVVAKYHVVDATNEIDVKHPADNGQIVVNNLAPAKAYNLTITAIDGAGNESENSKTVAVTTKSNVPTVAAPTPEWPALQVKSLYSDAYDFAPANLVGYNQPWWNNPNMTEEAVGEDHFLHYNLYRDGMIGAQFGEISVLNMEKIHLDIWASAAGSVTFRLITNEKPVVTISKTLELEADKWNSFDIDTADFGAGHDWATLYQFAIEKYQAGGLVGEHISVDNIYLYRTTELVDDEKPTDVKGHMASAAYFSVSLELSAKDNSGAVNFVVKNGEDIVATAGGRSSEPVNVTVNGLQPNTDYSFSVIAKDDAGNEADAITVTARTLTAPAAAPAPDFTNKEAVAVFCDVLEGGPAIKIGEWSQTTVASFVELAEGDKVCYLSNFNYLGWELKPVVDASDMEFLHVDLLSPSLTKVSVTPISEGHEGEVAIELTPNEWKSADIELSGYAAANIVWAEVFQFKFFNPNETGGVLFIDNVYFYKDSAETAIDQIVEPQKAVKTIENGQLVIIRDGMKYNVMGAQVK